MTADALHQCRVTSEMKTLARALAEREGITESRLIRQLLEVVLRTSALTDLPPPVLRYQADREARLSVRLHPDDRVLLSDRARARGIPSATHVSLVVRSHLRGIAPLPKAEYLALRQSVLQGRAEVSAMLRVAEGLRDHFKALLKANELSWRHGRGRPEPCADDNDLAPIRSR
jgi:antitoxin component of RelBE/YafQ-DinJ toxin-antitoxin module